MSAQQEEDFLQKISNSLMKNENRVHFLFARFLCASAPSDPPRAAGRGHAFGAYCQIKNSSNNNNNKTRNVKIKKG